MGDEGTQADVPAPEAHWISWHRAYEDPDSPLSVRLKLVQSSVRDALDRAETASQSVTPAPTFRIVSMCAGQGRDVIDVLAEHPRRIPVQALLVELDPDLAAFARDRAARAGLAESVKVTVVEGDASRVALYSDNVPADLVLVCGVFGNISEADIRATIEALPGLCALGADVVWTRHRRPPDLTPQIRAWFTDAGFEEVSFEDPDGFVLSVGRNRWTPESERSHGRPEFDPARKLFEFVGDGSLPA